MDSTTVSGTVDLGSIPSGCTAKILYNKTRTNISYSNTSDTHSLGRV